MKLISYARTSTDDKGQRPERQHEQNAAWAARFDGEIVAQVTDEGFSGETMMSARDSVLALSDYTTQADGIIITSVDRLTRGGVRRFWVEVDILEEDEGCKIFFSNFAPDADPAHTAIVWTVEAIAAAGWLASHRAATRAGMASKGVTGGRPVKKLTPAEREAVYELRTRTGAGWRKCAALVNEMRGVHKLATAKARQRAGVSADTVRALMSPLEGLA